MLKPQVEFPLMERYKKAFPAINNQTIIAYDKDIYTNYALPPDLLIHEQRHLAQQEKYGLENWVEYFLKDAEFRMKMELDAYREQLKSIKDREFRNKVRLASAKTLSSELYGNICSYQEALKLLSQK